MSEALALKASDLSLEGELPSLRVRRGKGARARIVPVHPELQNALVSALQFSDVGAEDRLVSATRSHRRQVDKGGCCESRGAGVDTSRPPHL